MKKLFSIIMLVIFSLTGLINAQQDETSRQRNIFDALRSVESGGQVHIYQDPRIEQMVVARKASSDRNQATISGFRVQVFSSNTQKTAKSDAFKMEQMIKEELPDVAVYVNYISPFWKVRVGDCRTQAQAQALRAKLIEAFPRLKSESYVVREQILVAPSN